MVAIAVGAFGGVRTPSLARPMLQSANAAFLRGARIEAAARLREALRRHLASLAALHRLDPTGDALALFERLRPSGVVCCLVGDLLAECDDVLAFRDSGKRLGSTITWAFELLDSKEDVR